MPAATLPTSNIADLLRPGPSRAAAEAAVNLVDVRKTYIRGTTHTRVLDGCTMSVGRGECAFLLGPSGSGKTTLLSIIGCVLSADSGEVSVLGRDVK
jgi:putative ABC transport system ATP-binding protein